MKRVKEKKEEKGGWPCIYMQRGQEGCLDKASRVGSLWEPGGT